ncbi:hypothetical protein AWZ03_001576 [Drosophila navojoa]|uniref:Uncharacterized protein n=1 Tax=Drosophila navojoa TaxID=7232 RepID=A0A484BSW8_DRONA|nr:hypothetical protein AWZ03_001576 [Drosophila navojoa]
MPTPKNTYGTVEDKSSLRIRHVTARQTMQATMTMMMAAAAAEQKQQEKQKQQEEQPHHKRLNRICTHELSIPRK